MVSSTETPVMIISTYPDRETVSKIASELVGAGIAACVNISAVSSFYSWKGEVVEGEAEHLAIFKTTSGRRTDLKKRIGETHPYDVPEIAEIPISDINEPYLRWMSLGHWGIEPAAVDTQQQS